MNYISAAGASLICGSQSTDYGNKRLLRHREYLVASPLPYVAGEPNYFTGSAIFDAPGSSNPTCNPSQTMPTSLSNWLASTNSRSSIYYYDSTYSTSYYLNGTTSPDNLPSQYNIGSTATSGCLSRFGIQDPLGYGTVFSDMFVRTNGTTLPPTATAVSSDYDSGNSDNGSFSFNGTLGPNVVATSSTWGYYSYFYFSGSSACSSNSTSVSSFIPATGLPVCTWSGSTQTLRTMVDYQKTYMLGSMSAGYPIYSTSSSSSATSYNMSSGVTGRFSFNLLNNATSSYLANLLCAIEAE